MSTERKPGSRGVTERSSNTGASTAPQLGNEPDTGQKQKSKGSTKTVSPRQSFKKRKQRK